MSSSRVKILLTWCTENGIQIDPRIQVRETRNHQGLAGDHTESSCSPSSRGRGISVCSLEDLIDCPCSLVRIPKAAVLSTRSCFLSHNIASALCGHTAHLALALALYGEILRGQDSKWFGYLQSLPRETVDMAIFWGVEDVIDFRSWDTAPSQSAIGDDASNVGAARPNSEFPEYTSSLQYLDGKRARMWLSCTRAEKELDDLIDEIRQYYVSVVEPTLHAAFGSLRQAKAEHNVNVILGGGIPRLDEYGNELNSVEPSLPGFCHAYSLVSSRAFLVDAYHGLAMVPIADAFNHTNENHVHMESDFDVCAECGSLTECDHDRETLPTVSSRGSYSLPGECKPDLVLEIDTLDMCSVKPILPHSEVFNTYGSLSNAELISRYGFTLPENECDIVCLGYGSFSAFINSLIDVVHSSADSGNDADMQNRVRNLSLPTDPRVLGDEREIADDFAIRFLRIYSHLARLWTTEPRWDEMGDNGLIYNSPSISSPRSSWDNPGSALPEAFNINSEGKLTHALWLFCVLFATCICSPEIMTNLNHSNFPDDNEPTHQLFVEDVKRHLVNVQSHIDNATETGDDDDEEASVSAWPDAPSDARDDPYPPVPQSYIMTETDIGGISKDENNVLASARDSACFISTPTRGSLGLGLPIGIRPCGEACTLAHAHTTNVPSVPSSASQATVWSGLRRRSNVGEERAKKRLRHSSPHTMVNQEDLPFDISGHEWATNAHRVAQTLALIVVHLCQYRVDSMLVSDVNASNLTAAELGELLDATPMHLHRTRVAMLLALSEMSILESCASSWGAILKNIHDINKE